MRLVPGCAVTAVLAVGISLLTTPAQAAPVPTGSGARAAVERSDSSPQADITRTTASVPPGKLPGKITEKIQSSAEHPIGTHPPALALACQQAGQARVGGRWSVTCSVPRADAGTRTEASATTGAVVKKVRLSLRVGKGARGLSVRGDGWRCSTKSRSATCRLAKVRPADSPPALSVTLKAAKRSAHLTGSLAWSQQKLSGGVGQPVSVQGWREQRTAARAHLSAARAVTVQAASDVTGQVSLLRGSPDPDRTVALLADVGRIAGRQVELRWRQTSGPAAVFADPARTASAAAATSTRVVLPPVSSKTQFCFRARALAEGTSAADTVCLSGSPERVGVLDPRMESVAQVGQLPPVNAGHHRAMRVKDKWAKIAGPTVIHVGAGRKVKLRAKIHQRHVASVRWKVVKGPRGMLGKRPRGKQLRFRAPLRVRDGVTIVQADMRLAKGGVIKRQKIIVVDGAGRPGKKASGVTDVQDLAFAGYGLGQLQAAGALTRRPGSEPEPPVDGTPVKTFCSLVQHFASQPGQSADMVLGDGTLMSIGAARVPQDCHDQNAVLHFTKAKLDIGLVSLVDAAGTVTAANGIRFERGAWTLPSDWDAAVPVSDLPVSVPFTVPNSAVFGARIDDDGTWAGLNGGLKFTSLDLFTLPGGWTWDEHATLVFEPETGLFIFEQSARAPAGRSGSLLLSGRLSTTGSMVLMVTVSGLDLTTNSKGETLLGAGTGELSILQDIGYKPDSQDIETKATFAFSAKVAFTPKASDSFEIVDGLRLKNGAAAWGSDGISVSAELLARAGKDSWMTFAGAGSYTSAEKWSMSVTARQESQDVGGVLKFAEVQGLFERVPHDKTSHLRVSLRGTVKDWNPGSGITVITAGGSLTNICPTDPKEIEYRFGPSGCQSGRLRMDLDAQATVATALNPQPVETTLTAWLRLDDLAFRFSGALTGVKIGPDELNITSVRLVVTNSGSAGTCRRVSQPSADPGTTALSFAFFAEGNVYGRTVSFQGQYDAGSGGGYCLLGKMQGSLPVADNAPPVDNVTVAYASYDAQIQEGAQWVPLRAKTVALRGGFTMPEAFVKVLGAEFAGRATFAAELTLGGKETGFKGRATYTLAKPVRLAGSDSGANVTLSEAGLELNVVGKNVSMAVMGRGALGIPGAGPPTPVAARISLDLATAQARFEAWVDTTDFPNGLPNAFGQEGLTVKELRVAFAVGPDSSVSVVASAILPARWTSSIVITPGTTISVMFSFSATRAPCLVFEIGTQGGTRNVLDVAGKDILTAKHAKFVFAPQKCTFGSDGSSRTVEAGRYELAFDGAIGGTTVNLFAALVLPTPQNPTSLVITANLQVGPFRAGPMTVNETKAAINIDTARGVYAFDFEGKLAFKVAGSDNTVDLRLAFSRNGAEISMLAKAQARLRIAGIAADCVDRQIDGRQIDGFRVEMASQAGGGAVTKFQMSMNCQFKVLGQQFDIVGQAGYEGGQLQKLYLQVGVSLNFGIARVSGALSIDYVRDPHKLHIAVKGEYKIPLFKPRSFNLTIVKEGSEASETYTPRPPVSTVGNPPYRWIATPPGCLGTDNIGDDGRPKGPIRCADAESRPASQPSIRERAWVISCAAKHNEPCPAELTDTVSWKPDANPNPPSQVVRQVRLTKAAQLEYAQLAVYTLDKHPYGHQDTVTVNYNRDGAMASNGYKVGPDRWPACFPARASSGDPCDVTRRGTLSGLGFSDRLLSNYLIRTSEAGRRQLSAESKVWRPGTTLTLHPGRRELPTDSPDPALLLPGDSFQSGPGTGIVEMGMDGNLHAKKSNGEWKWASGGNYHDPRPVAALLDDDCRLKLVDDSGLTRLESRNFRRFGGACEWSTRPDSEGVFRVWSGGLPGGIGDIQLMICGRGNQWGLQDGKGEWRKPDWAGHCEVNTDANLETNPVIHPEWFIDNGR